MHYEYITEYMNICSKKKDIFRSVMLVKSMSCESLVKIKIFMYNFPCRVGLDLDLAQL